MVRFGADAGSILRQLETVVQDRREVELSVFPTRLPKMRYQHWHSSEKPIRGTGETEMWVLVPHIPVRGLIRPWPLPVVDSVCPRSRIFGILGSACR